MKRRSTVDQPVLERNAPSRVETKTLIKQCLLMTRCQCVSPIAVFSVTKFGTFMLVFNSDSVPQMCVFVFVCVCFSLFFLGFV